MAPPVPSIGCSLWGWGSVCLQVTLGEHSAEVLVSREGIGFRGADPPAPEPFNAAARWCEEHRVLVALLIERSLERWAEVALSEAEPLTRVDVTAMRLVGEELSLDVAFEQDRWEVTLDAQLRVYGALSLEMKPERRDRLLSAGNHAALVHAATHAASARALGFDTARLDEGLRETAHVLPTVEWHPEALGDPENSFVPPAVQVLKTEGDGILVELATDAGVLAFRWSGARGWEALGPIEAEPRVLARTNLQDWYSRYMTLVALLLEGAATDATVSVTGFQVRAPHYLTLELTSGADTARVTLRSDLDLSWSFGAMDFDPNDEVRWLHAALRFAYRERFELRRAGFDTEALEVQGALAERVRAGERPMT